MVQREIEEANRSFVLQGAEKEIEDDTRWENSSRVQRGKRHSASSGMSGKSGGPGLWAGGRKEGGEVAAGVLNVAWLCSAQGKVALPKEDQDLALLQNHLLVEMSAVPTCWILFKEKWMA